MTELSDKNEDTRTMRFDDTLAYIDRIQRARTRRDVSKALLEVTSQYGLTSLLAGTMPVSGTSKDDQKDHIILSEWPAEWLERYAACNYIEHDPLIRFVKRAPAPATWHEAVAAMRPGRRGLRVFEDAGAFGLKDGFGLPLVTLEGAVVLVSFGGEHVELTPEAVQLVNLVSTYAVGRAMQLSVEVPLIEHRPELTGRERECMRWAAAGKSEWEISQILGISEHTSEKHLLNAKAKLGAANRVQAVAEAIRQGYI